MPTPAPYPVRVDATLDPRLSRWLWLVKWVLVIPHYIVLFFLWTAFAVLTLAAFFAILFTGRYPRGLFEFNVGVLRWTWRVDYYTYGALGTDRYPPFTLADVPNYPARVDIEYPERLSRGLVLVKWLLAIPHYLITGLFVGGGAWLAWRSDDWQWSWGGGGLVGILVLVAGIILAVTGTYPNSLFDAILGMNRWVLRVTGYAALMTDRYPPSSTATEFPAHGTTAGAGEANGGSGAGSAWTPGRTASVIAGGVLAFFASGLVIGGAATLWAGGANRDSAGYLTSASTTFSTAGRALASESMNVNVGGPAWAYPRSVLGDVRFRFTADDPSRETFVAVAPTSAVRGYLAGLEYATVTDFGSAGATYILHPGGAPATPPAAAAFWDATASGSGTQTLTWTPSRGDWTILVMNTDGSPGLSVRADAGANVPALTWVAICLLAAGLILLAASTALIAVPVARVSSTRPPEGRAASDG